MSLLQQLNYKQIWPFFWFMVYDKQERVGKQLSIPANKKYINCQLDQMQNLSITRSGSRSWETGLNEDFLAQRYCKKPLNEFKEVLLPKALPYTLLQAWLASSRGESSVSQRTKWLMLSGSDLKVFAVTWCPSGMWTPQGSFKSWKVSI